MPSGEEIQRALRSFVATWRDYTGSEKSEAQTFLNQLFACYGSDRRELGAEFEYFVAGSGFMDLVTACVRSVRRPIAARARPVGGCTAAGCQA